MIFSLNYLSRRLIICILASFFLWGCAHERGGDANTRTVVKPGGGKMRIALYPIDNLSGAFVQMKEIRASWLAKLKTMGLDVVDDEALEKTMERHRIRYIGGIDSEAAMAFKEETGADAVLITSLEYFNDLNPPKIALISRLTSTGENPRILWMDSVGLAGDDSPGILGLGLVNDLHALQEMALERLADSLALAMSDERRMCGETAAPSKYKPKQLYSALPVEKGKKTTIAVAPFYNDSIRKKAGDILQAHFTRQLACVPGVSPVEPGIVREKMLGIRMIMPGGVSIRDVDVLTYILEADYVLSGAVFDYQDPRGGAGTPKIDFSTLMINRGERKVVMLSKSYNRGDDGVFFYDVGRENNASVMAERMSWRIVRKLME